MRQVLLLTCLGLCLGVALEQPTLAANPAKFKVIGSTTNKDWDALRINTASGESWMAENALEWNPIPEAGTAPTSGDAGTYNCVVFYPAESTSFYAIRWNEQTGQSWHLADGKWTDVVVKDK